MKQLILAVWLLVGSTLGVAGTVMASNEMAMHNLKPSFLEEKNDMLGQKGVEYLDGILKNSKSYAYLVRLNTVSPELATQVKTVALLNEIHAINQNLSQLLVEAQKNNQMLTRYTAKGANKTT